MIAMFVLLALAQPAATVTPVAQGDMCGIDQARQLVVRDAAAWQELWKSAAPQKPLPSVALATRTILAIFAGSRPTSGYRVDVRRVRRDGAGLVVEYVELKPGPDTMTAQILTAPFVIVQIPRFDGDIRFERVDALP